MMMVERGMFRLDGKIAIITGGSSGIGKAAAIRFRQAGATVVIAARRDPPPFVEQIGATYRKTDICVESDVKALMDETVREFGRIDVLINNAGAISDLCEIVDMSAETMMHAFTVNTLGPLYGIKHAAPHMPPGSSIINTTSLAGTTGLPGYGDYVASKFAANGLTLCAALELGVRKIRVNAICPPSVNTPLLHEQDGGEAEIAVSKTLSALDRIIEPEDVAALMHFMASDDCPSFTGQLVRLDAGMTAGFSPALFDALGGVAA